MPPSAPFSSIDPQVMRRARIIMATTASVLALSACDDRARDTTAGERLDAAVARTEEATAAAARKAAELADKARDQTRAYIDSPQAREDAAKVKETFKEAGAALQAGAADATITASVKAALARDATLSAARIDVDTTGGAVRLTGPAPDGEAKARAETLARSVSGVVSVDNRLTVAPAGG